MKILIDKDIKNRVNVGDTVYSKCFDAYCIVIKEWNSYIRGYEYLLVDNETSIVLNRARSTKQLVLDSDLELQVYDEEIEIGDLLYSHVHETYCKIFRMIDDGREEYDYILIDVENGRELDQADTLGALNHQQLELIAKKSELTLTNIGGGKND